jgi:type II secretory pathway pseudopilin PulG
MAVNRGEAGFTLVELLVASAMSIVVLGGVTAMVIGAMRSQPEISKRAQDVSTARWILERLTREIRNGVRVDVANSNQVSFQTYVRHTTCGGTTALPSSSPAIKCEVTYTCTTTYCTRIEAAPEVYTGTATTIFEGIDSSNVFSYVPDAEEPTYVKVTLHLPNPDGAAGGGITVSDGASMRNAILGL